MCVCVCVCEREREGERESEGEIPKQEQCFSDIYSRQSL